MPYTQSDRPERIPEIFMEAWNHRDPGAVASLFAEDGEFVNVTGLWFSGSHDSHTDHRAEAPSIKIPGEGAAPC